MNGLEKSGLNEADFGAKGSVVSAFDAFPKAKPEYIQRTSGGGKWTVATIIIFLFFLWSEASRWWRGGESHHFDVEKGVAHNMQINLDVVVKMHCSDLHINVQDASGDRILAAEKLRKDSTKWDLWADTKGVHKLGTDSEGRVNTGAGWSEAHHDEGFGEEHVHDIIAATKRKAKWAKTPRSRGATLDSCRIYGSLDLNKVQGDFHITARGHGYEAAGEHLDHKQFNFSHIVSELSFGPFYPSLINPLDRTVNLAPQNFHKFQYYVSVVPTMYILGGRYIQTNQYAVTEQSKKIDERMTPGIFLKYDIEPILLTVEEHREGVLFFFVKMINMFGGVMVAAHWGFTLSEWAKESFGKRRKEATTGFLGSGKGAYEA